MSSSVPRARHRLAFLRVSLIVLGLTMLTACRVDTVVTLDIFPNGAGTLTVNLTADKQVIDQTPKLATDFRFDDAKSAGWVVAGPNVLADGGLQVSISHAFSNASQATTLLAQLSGANGPFKQLTLTRIGKDSDSTFKLDGALQVDGGLAAFSDADLLQTIGAEPFAQNLELNNLNLAGVSSINFVVNLPGKIEQTTGTATKSTITWQVPLDGNAQLVTTTSRNTAITAIVAKYASVILKFVLVFWLIGMTMIISRVVAKRKDDPRTPSE